MRPIPRSLLSFFEPGRLPGGLLLALVLVVPLLAFPAPARMGPEPRGVTRDGLNKAWVYYRQRNYQEARRILGHLEKAENTHPEVYFLMGRVLYAQNKFAGARDRFKDVLPRLTNPQSRRAVRYLRDRAAGLHDLNLHRRQFNRFTIFRPPGVPPDMPSRANHHMEEAYRKIGGDMNFFPDDRLTIILYPSAEYRRVVGAPVWSGGVFDGKIHLRLRQDRSEPYSRRTLYHEYTHALTYALARNNVPLWFNEGLATFQEHRQTPGTFRYQFMRMHPPEQRLRTLSDINRLFKQRGDEKAVRLAYEYSHAMMAFLREQYGLPAIKRLLDRTGETSSFEQALSDEFRTTPSGLQREWELWVRNSLFR